MLARKFLGFAMFATCVQSASVSIERRQGGCEGLGNYPPYTGPCETEST
jgi:hypothetical protein